MNYKPNQLAYVAKIMPWYSTDGDRGEIDVRGKVVRTLSLVAGDDGGPAWKIAEPFTVNLLHLRPKPLVQTIRLLHIGDMWLRPLEDGGLDRDEELREHEHDLMVCRIAAQLGLPVAGPMELRHWNCRCVVRPVKP